MTPISTGEIIYSLIGAVSFSFLCALIDVALLFVFRLMCNLGEHSVYYIKCITKREKIKYRALHNESRVMKEIISCVSLIISGLIFSVFMYVYLDGQFKAIPTLFFCFSFIVSAKLLSKIVNKLHVFLNKALFYIIFPMLELLYILYGIPLAFYEYIKKHRQHTRTSA